MGKKLYFKSNEVAVAVSFVLYKRAKLSRMLKWTEDYLHRYQLNLIVEHREFLIGIINYLTKEIKDCDTSLELMKELDS